MDYGLRDAECHVGAVLIAEVPARLPNQTRFLRQCKPRRAPTTPVLAVSFPRLQLTGLR
jgi:hypothetical protein